MEQCKVGKVKVIRLCTRYKKEQETGVHENGVKVNNGSDDRYWLACKGATLVSQVGFILIEQ